MYYSLGLKYLKMNTASTQTHIFHVVLDSVLLKVGRRLRSVEPLSRIHVGLLEVVPVDLQLVVGVGAQVHCSDRKTKRRHKEGDVDRCVIFNKWCYGTFFDASQHYLATFTRVGPRAGCRLNIILVPFK